MLIAEWCIAHRVAGGESDGTVELLLKEVTAAQESEIPALKGGGGQLHYLPRSTRIPWPPSAVRRSNNVLPMLGGDELRKVTHISRRYDFRSITGRRHFKCLGGQNYIAIKLFGVCGRSTSVSRCRPKNSRVTHCRRRDRFVPNHLLQLVQFSQCPEALVSHIFPSKFKVADFGNAKHGATLEMILEPF
jgi:hypothetical protein